MKTDDYAWLLAPLGTLSIQLPVIFAYLAGIIIAVVRWTRHPRISLFVVLALSVEIVLTVVLTFVYAWLPYYLLQNAGYTPTQYGTIFAILNFVAGLVRAAAFVLLLFAIFLERSDRPKQS